MWTPILARLTKAQRKSLGGLIDLSNPPDFLEFAREALAGSGQLGYGGRVLLQTSAVTWGMLLPGGLSRDQARQMAARIQQATDFDLRLVQVLSDYVEETAETGLNAAGIELVLRGLDLIEHIGAKPRLFLPLVKFVKHPDGNIRSKAAKVVGQITVNQGWVERHASALEPRVRSNVLEAIAENPEIPKKQLFDLLRRASRDPHHRVAVTALFLLARRGDAESLERLELLLTTGEPPFQKSAAWALSQLRTPCD